VYERGVHVRTIVSRESEWNHEQQAWLLALAVYREGLCRRCGGELHETSSEALNPDNRWSGTHIYKSKPPKRCHRCTALMASEKAFHATDKDGEYITHHPGALIHQVEKVERRRRG